MPRLRRAPIVLTTTAAGLAAVLGFHAHAQPVPGTAQAPAATAPAKNGGAVRQLTGTDVPNQTGTCRCRSRRRADRSLG